MDRGDIVLVVAASYVAVVSLVRLMANRRNQLVEKIRARGRPPTRPRGGRGRRQR